MKIKIPEKMPKADFIRMSQALFVERFTYGRIIEKWIYAEHPVIITCVKHGDFMVTPTKHFSSLISGGCEQCKKKRHSHQTYKYLIELQKKRFKHDVYGI